MEDNDELELNPPEAAAVSRRAAIIKYQFVYVATTPPPELVAGIAAQWSQAERNQFASQLEATRCHFVDQLRQHGLWEDTSSSERALFEQPTDAINERQRINTSWRAEAAHCLAWALGLVEEIPDYDCQTDPEIIIPLIPTPDGARSDETATLRDRAEIERAREIAELWHWRSRTKGLQDDEYQPKPGQPTRDAIVRQVAPRMKAAGLLESTIDDDFPVLGRAYRDLTDDQWATARSIAMERHFALNWLCGYAPENDWDETPTDT